MSTTITLPLVAAQPGIWVAEQTALDTNVFIVAHSTELRAQADASLNVEAFVQAIRQVMAEVDTLNAHYGDTDGVPWQQWPDVRHADEMAAPVVFDLSHDEHADERALQLMQEDLQQDLRISEGQPLYRHLLIKVAGAPERWLWYQRYHHLAVDGFSFAAIARRIGEVYHRSGADQPLGDTPFTPFAAVVDEYRQYHASPRAQKDADFWQQQLAALPAPVTLSEQALDTARLTTKIVRHDIALPEGALARLEQLGETEQVTGVDMALTLLALWVARLSGQSRYAAGMVFMRRLGSAALTATGPVVNVLPLGVELNLDEALVKNAQRLARTVRSIKRHQRYDAEQIQRDARQLTAAPHGVVFNVKMFDHRLRLSGWDDQTHEWVTGPVRDLELVLHVGENGALSLTLQANAQRYTSASLASHAARIAPLFEQAMDSPMRALGDLDMLLPEEHALLANVNATDHPVPDTTLPACLREQALRTPEAIALRDDTHTLTYRQVRQQVEALAAALAEQGVQRGDIVALALPRSVRLTLAMMAVVELGAAWLPLDLGYPDDRLQLMCDDARPRRLITDHHCRARFDGTAPIFCYDALLATTAIAPVSLPEGPDPQDAAYVLYTSGSTGRPKGVVVSHRAIVNRLLWMQDRYPLSEGDAVLQKTPCGFDVSVWEFFWPMMVGATLVMAPPEAHRDPEQLLALIDRYQVGTLHFVPSMLATFMDTLAAAPDDQRWQSLTQVFCSGEALPTGLAQRWQQHTHVPLHNLYGPTEAAIDVTYYPAFGESLAQVVGSSVPIGLPVWNTRLRLLDERLQPVPPGVAGELFLSGVQLADGYLHREELTAQQFMAAGTSSTGYPVEERMYATGDIARWRDDGVVEYLGRRDGQLKLRGQRIELGEIEHVLAAQPSVGQAAVAAMVLGQVSGGEQDQRQLVGYITPAQPDERPDSAALHAVLRQQLPAHMVPVTLVVIDALPLSANGKLDRKQLPVPTVANDTPQRLPQTVLEQRLAAVFSRFLGIDTIHLDDDFFALGGHSLLAMQVIAELRRWNDQPISIGLIMEAPTVAQLAEALGDEAAAAHAGLDETLTLRRPSADGATLFCFHPASGFSWQFSSLLRYLDSGWGLIGLQSPVPDGVLATSAHMAEACDRHLATLQRVQPHGPYYLIGYSLGGTLAQGVAARLQALGEEVRFLGLLDTYPPETQQWDGVLDDEVLREIERERERFMTIAADLAPQNGQQDTLFDDIGQNYADAVRLLSTTRTDRFNGTVTLFAATESLPEGWNVREVWAPYVGELCVHPLPCRHVDIIAPGTFEQLGQLIRQSLQVMPVQ
ncbi:amino acid adenylation domain-containing protein [Zymobacter sp. IVIA_12111.31 C1]|uniref:amino acid adenylation domain-containing protein n=1 Tax=Zymobacter sp. IVIA_12111.31 C1 TaxID=3394854 RepID=UPI0039C0FC2A